MTRYSIEPRTRKYFKRCGFLLFGRKSSNMYGKKVLKAATKTGLDGLKTATKIVAHKGGEFIRHKITKKIVGPKPLPDDDLWNVEKIIIPQETREEILNELKQVL